MKKAAFEICYYMYSINPIVEWLKSEGVNTRKQAIKRLTKFLKENPIELDVLITKLSVTDDKQLIDTYSGRYFNEILNNFPDRRLKK